MPDASNQVARGERDGGRVAFESVTTHQQLCNDITNIEVRVSLLVSGVFHSPVPMFQFPVQAARILSSHSLRHMFSVCSEPSVALRFTYWLEHSLGYGTYEY